MKWSIEKQDQFCESLANGQTSDEIDPADQVMLDYALKLNREPHAMNGSDVDQLREAGFDDRSIHDICCITAYYAFVNRVADGLGVQLEAEFES